MTRSSSNEQAEVMGTLLETVWWVPPLSSVQAGGPKPQDLQQSLGKQKREQRY